MIASPPRLSDLPTPPADRCGWPWTEASPPLPSTRPDGSAWPRISIVTPSYNQGQFIEETIRSILLQGYPNLEYLIAEDCSTDNTLEVLEPYRPWLKVLEAKANGGMAAAINRGFARASGDIVTWISSDDVYLPGAFRAVASVWDHQVGAIFGAFRFMDPRSRLDTTEHPARVRAHSSAIDLTLEDPASWRLHQVSAFYGRAALDDVGRFTRADIRHNPDRELLYRVARRHPIATVPDCLAAFRIHPQSKSWSQSNMLTMADEFASVFLRFDDGDRSNNRRRQRIAGYHRAKGYAKFAKYSPDRGTAAIALLRAAAFSPRYALSKGYFQAWARVLGLRAATAPLEDRGVA